MRLMRMRTRWSYVIVLSVLSVLLVPDRTSAQTSPFYVYPKQGQTAKQQEQDQGECHVWAVQNSGYNPYVQSGGSYTSGGLIRGAAGGAAVGAVGGAIGGNAGKGAAIGAGAGALLGGVRQHQHNQRTDAMNRQTSNEYRRALRACLEGRGYSVN
jgi:hypothetical protein